MHSCFDFVGNVAGEFQGGQVVNLLRLNNHANFATGGDGVGLVDAGETGGDIFEGTHPLGKVLGRDVASARTSGGDGVNNFHDDGFWRGRLNVVVMCGNRVDNLVFHAKLLRQFGANFGVLAFDFVRHGLAHVV